MSFGIEHQMQSRKTVIWRKVCAVLLLLLTCSVSAEASVTDKDFRVIIRAIGFLQPPVTGNKDFAIVYDPSNASSAAEGKKLASLLGDSFKVGGAQLQPRLVSVGDLGGLSRTSFIYMAEGTGAHQSRISDIAKASHALTMSLDRGCVEKGDCVMYLNTDKRVEILVNKTAASAAQIEFKPVFMVMVSTL